MALVFKVRRSELELVKPSKPTPNGVKPLSDWDDKESLRDWVSHIMFYGYSASATTPVVKDPVETIKKALAEALVYYYPFAGRLKEQGPEKKLAVDCTAEGVVFVSADADVRLDQFGVIQPPIPCMSELLYDKITKTVGCPIFVMQVTRLACGGFIVAFRFNHVMADLVGAVQFLMAISELVCGATAPSVLPVWQRELLNVRRLEMDPTSPCVPRKSDVVPSSTQSEFSIDFMTYRSFFFGPQQLQAIRARLPQRPGDRFSSFDLISTCVFHCLVVSLENHAHDDQVRVAFIVNARSKFTNPPLPLGYYGNASFSTSIIRPLRYFHDLRYVAEEVKKAKDAVTEDFVRSTIKERVMERRSGVPKAALTCRSFVISDITRVGLSSLDFGSGKPVYAGNMEDGKNPNVQMPMIASKNDKGEEGRLITLYMLKDAMDKFELKLCALLGSTKCRVGDFPECATSNL